MGFSLLSETGELKTTGFFDFVASTDHDGIWSSAALRVTANLNVVVNVGLKVILKVYFTILCECTNFLVPSLDVFPLYPIPDG